MNMGLVKSQLHKLNEAGTRAVAENEHLMQNFACPQPKVQFDRERIPFLSYC
jgi:hypothetical protein